MATVSVWNAVVFHSTFFPSSSDTLFWFNISLFTATASCPRDPRHFALFPARRLIRIRNLHFSTRVGDISLGVHSHKYLLIVTQSKLV